MRGRKTSKVAEQPPTATTTTTTTRPTTTDLELVRKALVGGSARLRVEAGHALRGEADDVERADGVDLEDLVKVLERVRPPLVQRLAGS